MSSGGAPLLHGDAAAAAPVAVAAVNSSSSQVGGTASSGASLALLPTKLSAAGAPALPRVNESSEPPLAPSPSSRLLSRGASVTDDGTAHNAVVGAPSHVRAAAEPTVAASVAAAPRTPPRRHPPSREDGVVPGDEEEEEGRGRVHVVLMNASRQTFGRFASGSSERQVNDDRDDNDGTGGSALHRCTGGATTMSVPSPQRRRVVWSRLAAREPCAHGGSDGAPWPTTTTRVSAPGGGGGGGGRGGRGRGTMQHAAPASQSAQFAKHTLTPATETVEQRATADSSLGVSDDREKDKEDPLHAHRRRRCRSSHVDFAGMEVSASSTSSIPHSMAETQWVNTSEAMELDAQDLPLPLPSTAGADDFTTVSASTASPTWSRAASPLLTCAKVVGEAGAASGAAAKPRSSIAVPATIVPHRRGTAGPQQLSGNQSEWRRKRSDDESAALSGRNSYSVSASRSSGGAGDTPLVSVERSVTWSGARRTEDSVSSPLASPELKPKLQQQQQRQRRSMDSSELVPSSPPQAAANGAQSTVDLSSAACNPSGSYVSLRSMGSHNGAQRAVPLSRACPPRRAVAPPLQLPTPLGPGDGGAAGANLGVSVRSPLGMSNSVGLPMFMSGSTASLMAFPRYDAATPPRTAHNTAAAPPVRNDVDPPLAPGSRAQQRDSEVERPPLPPTVPSAQAPPSPVAAVLQRSSSIAAASARHGSSRGSPFTPSPSQSQQRQLSPSSRFPRPGEANPFEIGSLNSLSAMPQRSQRTFTVTSAASLGVDNGANAFGSRSRAAAHSSLHDSAISMWQSSTMLSDHILQTLAHGMALGGVSTAPWNAALENATSLPPNSPAHDGAVRRLAAKALPPQSPGAQPWPRSGAGGGSAAHAMRAVVAPSSASSQSVTSTAAGVDRAMHGSPMNQTAHQCGSSLLVPLMHGGGGGGGPARSLGGWGVAGAPQPQSVAPGQDGSGEAAEAGCYSPTPSIPLAPASASLTPAHSPRHAPRYRASPGAGYFFAAADGSLRDAGGYSATTPPTSLSAALHTERSLVTPMRGYNFARRSTVASVAQPSMMLRPELSTSAPLLAHAGRGNRSTVASSALSQASLGAEGVMFSAGGTPNEVGEAPMVSGAAADDPTRMLRPADSGATHHYATSVADSGVAVAAPTEASLVVPSMFLQSVHDSGAGVAAAPHAPAAPLSMCAAAQRLLAAAVLAGGSGRAGALPPTVPVSLAKIGPMPGLARRLPTGSESTQPSDGTTDTRTSALATAAAVPSGSSEESPNGVSTVAAVSPPPLPHWSAPAASAPMQLPQPRVSLVHRLSDTASGTDTHTSDEPRRCSTAPVTAAPQRQVSGSSDLVAAAATPPLISRIVSIKETGSVRPGEGTTSSFLPVLPLAQEEAAGATSLSCEPTPVVGPMPSGPCPNTPRSPPQQYQQHQQQHQQQQQQQQQWWASAVARAAAPFSGSGNTARAVTSVTTHRNSSSPDDLRSIPPSFGRAPARLTQPQLQPPAQPLLPRPSTLAASPPRDVAELPASDFAGDGRVEPGSQSSTADRAAGTGERYGHSRRANRGMLFHRRSTLTNGSGSRSRQIDDSGSGGGDGGSGGGGGGSGGGAAHRISIPRYQRHHDVESLLDDAERAMNRAAVPIVPVLGLGSRAIEVGEIPFGVLGNGLASSMMSLRTPAMTVSITGSDRGLVSVLAMGSASEKLFSSPSDTAPSFPTSAPTRR
ncbi:hypothetical protein NESM_000358600 [Novymonas esmeraldas]|uniref:Uncharacterized protein n=1 Tax=Novymonas esmeraldas TaxID=1808958 RepID=A0AAW0ELV5_9TRYP